MTLHQLRVFLTVARLGNFSRAADELGISQPSVSIQVADLERSLGVELFEQHGKRINLTAAGRRLEGYAHRILGLAAEATSAMREPQGAEAPSAVWEPAGVDAEASPRSGRVPPFEAFDHTADVGIVAHGATLPELFSNAASGMMAFIIQPALVRAAQTRRLTVEADDREGLLVAWLNELLVLLNGDGFVPREFQILEFSDTRLLAEVGGEPVDQQRHRFRLDVKAATYHQLAVEREDGWHARIIFDV